MVYPIFDIMDNNGYVFIDIVRIKQYKTERHFFIYNHFFLCTALRAEWYHYCFHRNSNFLKAKTNAKREKHIRKT